MKSKKLWWLDNEDIRDVVIKNDSGRDIDISESYNAIAKEVIVESSQVPEKINIVKKFPDYVVFTTKLQTCEKPGKNGVFYSKNVMREAIERDARKLIRSKTLYGEMDHPMIDFENVSKFFVVNRLMNVLIKEASHFIVDIWFEDNDIYGRIETINDAGSGKKLSSIVAQGGKPGFSLRALGPRDVNKRGQVFLKYMHKFVTYDSVANPSFEDAWMRDLENKLYESKEISMESIQMESQRLMEMIEDPAVDDSIKNSIMNGTLKDMIIKR